MTDGQLRVMVAGSIAAAPGQAGASWAVLQYVLGLRRLGHDVLLVEPVAPEADAAVSSYFTAVVDEFGLTGRASLLTTGSRSGLGVAYDDVRAFAQTADLVINISGMLRDDDLLAHADRRLFLDLDPAFVQLWHVAEGIDMGFDRHTHFATVGLNVGTDRCDIPTDNRTWLPTLPPVVLSSWERSDPVPGAPFTTVGNWRGYGSIHLDGIHYGQRAHSMRALLTLPGRSGQRFVMALAIAPEERPDLDALALHGWELVDPASVAATPGAYSAFIGASCAEFGVAKSGYVVSRSGWFSDRSACYLATGRPVVAQDTGFGSALPTGDGLLAYTDVETASAAVAAVRADPARHATAARDIAETLLDSDRVLTALLDHVASDA